MVGAVAGAGFTAGVRAGVGTGVGAGAGVAAGVAAGFGTSFGVGAGAGAAVLGVDGDRTLRRPGWERDEDLEDLAEVVGLPFAFNPANFPRLRVLRGPQGGRAAGRVGRSRGRGC